MRPKLVIGVFLSLLSTAAAAQLPFPPNWLNAPVGIAKQDVYPYPGQCYTGAPIGDLPACQIINPAGPGYAPSFLCPAGGGTNQTAFSAACGAVTAATVVNPIDPATQLKFQWEVLNPPDYTPDTTTVPGVEYYEIGLHEAQGFQALASAGLFPNPLLVAGGTAVPEGKQWTGLVDPVSGAPLFTPIWGVGQINMGGGPATTVLSSVGTCSVGGAICAVNPPAPDACVTAGGTCAPLFTPGAATAWSANSYVATWPSISIRGQTGKPVRVKWVNEFPNTHLYCPHPEAADWPCAIDRAFMGVKATIDPQKAPPTFNTANGVLPYKVNQFGSPQQPDNSWVTHLHGGEIQPSVDGFAERWYGNRVTGAIYAPTPWPLDPVFRAPFSAIDKGDIANPLSRPAAPAPPGAQRRRASS